jgi:hypothetical protein
MNHYGIREREIEASHAPLEYVEIFYVYEIATERTFGRNLGLSWEDAVALRDKLETRKGEMMWKTLLSAKERKHIRTWTNGTLADVKRLFAAHEKLRVTADRRPELEPCWTCREIRRKLLEVL